jgi:hypothetical protein
MTEQPRDWDRELANIDRTIAKQQPAATGPVQTGPPIPTPPARRFVALTWFWTGLAVLLAVALLLWPYDKNCGIRLVFFIGAGGLALLAGIIGALTSWAHHRGLAHLLSLLVVVWAGVMVMREILPRAGYAKIARDWTCPPPPPVPNPAPPAPPSGQPGT